MNTLQRILEQASPNSNWHIVCNGGSLEAFVDSRGGNVLFADNKKAQEMNDSLENSGERGDIVTLLDQKTLESRRWEINLNTLLPLTAKEFHLKIKEVDPNSTVICKSAWIVDPLDQIAGMLGNALGEQVKTEYEKKKAETKNKKFFGLF